MNLYDKLKQLQTERDTKVSRYDHTFQQACEMLADFCKEDPRFLFMRNDRIAWVYFHKNKTYELILTLGIGLMGCQVYCSWSPAPFCYSSGDQKQFNRFVLEMFDLWLKQTGVTLA